MNKVKHEPFSMTYDAEKKEVVYYDQFGKKGDTYISIEQLKEKVEGLRKKIYNPYCGDECLERLLDDVKNLLESE